MKRTKSRMAIAIVLIALLLIFIWGNSCLPAKVSAAFSGWVKNLLNLLFGQSASDAQTGHGLLRKIAHFGEFALLGMCLYWLFSMLGKKFPLSLFCGFLVGCTDETIQCFVPDRGPAFTDVLIDTAGVVVGIALLLCMVALQKRKNKMKYLEETKQ